MQSNGTILAVDDEAVSQVLLAATLLGQRYNVITANDGAQAWKMLEHEPERFDAVLLDRTMPNMGGMELLAKVRAHPKMRFLPVIMQTAAANDADIAEGMRAGAYHYLTKPINEDKLLAVVRAAVEDVRGYRSLQNSLDTVFCSLAYLTHAEFSVNTLDDVKNLAQTLSKACPRPQLGVIGLLELMINAHEHGNLGISYDEKGRLMEAGNWLEEILRREKLPENLDKQVRVAFERMPGGVRFTIRDQGEGFDWPAFMNLSLERAFDTHGRGIAISRTMSFSRMVYEGRGNAVIAEMRADSGEESRDEDEAV